MRAVQIDVHGGPEVLSVREVADPRPGPGEVLIRTVASSLNPVDWKTRVWDVGPAFPMTLGWDLAGIVVASSSAGFAVGDRVIAMSAQVATGRGTWAELVALPEQLVTAAPATITLPEAATLPLAGTTALQALAKLDLAGRKRLLVTGAAGAVGGLAVQLAKHAGITVDGLVSRPEHAAVVRDLGAGTVVDHAGDLPKGAYDAVFDTAGVDVSLAVAEGGRYVSVSDEPLPDVPGATKSYVQESAKDLAELVALVDAGELRVRVAEHHPVTEVRVAHERFEAGGLSGKVVLLF
ncbi:NADP-dependent oxidoreductase [Streptomyces abikoensis]|uniref:NADP-dependent oxidoreductase n=1 Tax=Streptomyces abikoensis TaxID=97398 RepID=A0ABW7SX47_9ACTN